jgi:glycine oxidase
MFHPPLTDGSSRRQPAPGPPQRPRPERASSSTQRRASNANPDVIIVGGGLIGLACAAAVAERGARVVLLAPRLAGEASGAAAGLLAPSLGHEPDVEAARGFATAARDRYPDYLRWLEERTGVAVPLNREGILEVEFAGVATTGPVHEPQRPARRLSPANLKELEPLLGDVAGGVLHPLDGAVDNVLLLDALRALVAAESRIDVRRSAAARLEVRHAGVAAVLQDGERLQGATIVLAAGAWLPTLAGLPRPLPIAPVKGQMLAFDQPASPVRHAISGPGCYLVPRSHELLAGSTMEHTGFDSSTDEAGIDGIRQRAASIIPALQGVAPTRTWAGLRPVTPDLLPILDRDPEYPAVVYACGHSKNGVLMAPLTGDCVGALVAGEEVPYPLNSFKVTRFASG